MFSKKPDEYSPASAPMARQSASGSTFSVIGSDVVIKGDVSASNDLHVDGRIEGDIQCASLVQGEGSEIQGGVQAETARIGGTVSGSITARELFVLRTARINGDVHYDALTIEQGAEVEGRFAHRVPQQRQAAAPKAVEDGEPKLSLAN